jgi:hypothetical protein
MGVLGRHDPPSAVSHVNRLGRSVDRPPAGRCALSVDEGAQLNGRVNFSHRRLCVLVGLAAITFSAVYLASDIVEVVQGNFSTVRLILTYVGESMIPLFVVGIFAAQRPSIGWLGLCGAMAYSYSYVFFTSTVVYALVAGVPDYRALTRIFGPWMTVHGAIMLIGGVAFGVAVVRARVLPRWTGACLMGGVVLVSLASGLPSLARAVAEAGPAVAFIGMGIALLSGCPVVRPGSDVGADPGREVSVSGN